MRSPFNYRFGLPSPFYDNEAGFSPSSLFSSSQPGVWFDPSDLTTLFQDSAGTTPVTEAGQPVGRVLDKSGRGNHATQSTSASRPTYLIDGTGRPYLSFDGVDDGMVTSTITPETDKVQVFAGVRKLSDAALGIFCEFSATTTTNDGAFRMSYPPNNGQAGYGFLSRGTTSSIANVTSGFAAPITNVVTGIGDISGDVVTQRINGTQVATSSGDQGTGNYLAYPLYIGRRGGTTLPFTGNLYSLIVRFGANLADLDITRTEEWVNGKTGAY
jgi:hypothetical protein